MCTQIDAPCLYPFILRWSLGCFCISVTVNGAAVIIGVHVSFQIPVLDFWGYKARSRTAGSCGSSFVGFWRKLHNVFCVAVPVHILTNSGQGFPFLLIFTSVCYLSLSLFFFFFIINITGKWRECLIVVLIFISLVINDVEYLLCTCWPFVSPLWRNVFSGLLPIIKFVFFFFFLLLRWLVLCIVWLLTPLLFISFGNIFSHSVGPHFVASLCTILKLLNL